MDWRTHIARYGRQWFPGEDWVRTTFIILFALAAVLRFWNLPNLPYTHDELSALVRIYPTLGETIQRGVIELDTHPPGVQVFERIWTKAFGMGEGIVKLPFILLALVALFFLYRFALAWTSAPTALVSIAMLATLQYTVLYAQIARPYAIGFFTTALLADQLTRYLAFGTRRALIGTGIAIILCAYTHHFALLLAGIMVLTGLGLVQPAQRKNFLVMCAVAALLYLPNLPIFIGQLGLGGLDGWLQPPGVGWIPGYINWILHFSPLLIVITLLVVLLSLALRLKNGPSHSPAKWMLPLWGLAPLIIGFAYSWLRSPVLQYSMLLFSFPFILFAVFGGLRTVGRKQSIIMSSVVALTGTFTLICTRHHFDVYQGSRYEAMVQTAHQRIQEHGADRTLVLFDAPEPQIQFYMQRAGLSSQEVPYVQLRNRVPGGALDSLLVQAKGGFVVLGISNGSEPEDIARIQSRFPYIVDRAYHLEGTVYVFSDRQEDEKVIDRTLIADGTPALQWGGIWDIHADLPVVHDGTQRTTNWLFQEREFGLGTTLALDPKRFHPNDQFEVIAEVQQTAPYSTSSVVMTLKKDGSTQFFRSSSLASFDRTDRIRLCVAASPSWALNGDLPNTLQAYIADQDRTPLLVHQLSIYDRFRNPIQNALFDPVERP